MPDSDAKETLETILGDLVELKSSLSPEVYEVVVSMMPHFPSNNPHMIDRLVLLCEQDGMSENNARQTAAKVLDMQQALHDYMVERARAIHSGLSKDHL